jgi:hypothetical protein
MLLLLSCRKARNPSIEQTCQGALRVASKTAIAWRFCRADGQKFEWSVYRPCYALRAL